MMHPELARVLVEARYEALRAAALPTPRRPRQAQARAVDPLGIELRMCRVDDDAQLDDLAALSERPLPGGSLVLALRAGRIVAALPVSGGRMLADPFVRTSQLEPLLELRAAQIRGDGRRLRLRLPALRLARSSSRI